MSLTKIRVAFPLLALSCLVILFPAILQARQLDEKNDVARVLLNILTDETYSQCRADTQELFDANPGLETIIDDFHCVRYSEVIIDGDSVIIDVNFHPTKKLPLEMVCNGVDNSGIFVEPTQTITCNAFDEEQGKEIVTSINNYADCFANTPACESVDYMEYLAVNGITCTETGEPDIGMSPA
jgi:hypothetical protein